MTVGAVTHKQMTLLVRFCLGFSVKGRLRAGTATAPPPTAYQVNNSSNSEGRHLPRCGKERRLYRTTAAAAATAAHTRTIKTRRQKHLGCRFSPGGRQHAGTATSTTTLTAAAAAAAAAAVDTDSKVPTTATTRTTTT